MPYRPRIPTRLTPGATIALSPGPEVSRAEIVAPRCSNLITSERLLDYVPKGQLEFCENCGTFRLTLPENRLGLIENNLRTSDAAEIQ